MKHEFEFTFDVAFIKAALRRDLLWKGYVLAGIFLSIAGILRLVNDYWDPMLTAVFGLGAFLLVWRFHALLDKVAHQVCAMWLKLSPGRVIRFEFDDEGFSVIHENSQSHFMWKGLRRLWRYDDVWMVEIVKMQSVFFPPDQVRDEVRTYIVERCEAAGVRV